MDMLNLHRSLTLVATGLLTTWGSQSLAEPVWTQAPERQRSQVQGAPATPPQPVKELNWTAGPVPEWIWGVADNGPCVLRTTFRGGATSARLRVTCDNEFRLLLNGEVIAASSNWEQPVEVDVLSKLKPDENVLVAEASNEGGVCGFVLKLVLEQADGTPRYVTSSGEWQGAAKRAGAEWGKARVIKSYGAAPWGDVLARVAEGSGAVRDVFELRPGFQVERLFTVPREELGSWVSITFDERGRLLASDQGDKGICRITPASNGQPTQVERLDLKISAAQGMLCAFGHLYLSVNGGIGSGLYRAKYDPATDQYGPVEKLREFRGGGEHGPHALRLSPDGKSLYVICGNHTKPPFDPIASGAPQEMGGARGDVLTASLPAGMSSRILPNWDEDLLLPREWDARGHARGILAPGGWIAHTDPEGKSWEIVSIGYRNPYDMAFNADGELFAYDADMEWDLGMPWYRPTRVVHATSGSEFGWRSGTAKWPAYYVDSLPPVVDIGPGSPVGIEFGYGTKFPARYQRALFICDWTFGTMYAIHLAPQGASYTGTKEEFLSRTPLPLTDCAVGPDGALYFTIGGRGTQSELFRVTYVGDESTAPVSGHDAEGEDQRELRRQLESLHTGVSLTSALAGQLGELSDAYEALGGEDRFLRYAARIAFEQMAHGIPTLPADTDFRNHIQSRDHLIQFAVIIARTGRSELKHAILQKLVEADLDTFSERQELDYLRALELVFIRVGPPDDALRHAFLVKLESRYPSESVLANRELVQLLVFLESPTIVEKTVAFLGRPTPQGEVIIDPLLARNDRYGKSVEEMLRSQPDAERIWAAFVLRNAKSGWTLDLKKQFYTLLSTARQWKGGASYQGFLNYIDGDVWDGTPEKERLAIEGSGVRKPFQLPELPKPRGPGHEWTLAEVLAAADGRALERGRDFKNGERTFAAARCIVCHRFAGDGGATGPDLTQLAGRFNLKDLSEAILDPSKVVSDQYKATTIVTTGGQIHTGRVLNETGETVSILVDPEDASKVIDVPRGEIDSLQPAAASLMPANLLKPLNEAEVLDLLAYLLSRGDEGHRMFRK